MEETALQPISVRYKQAALEVLDNLRTFGETKMGEVLVKYNCALPLNPTEEQITDWQKFQNEVYPALPRLMDLRSKTIEAIHRKAKTVDILSAESIANLTQLLKTLDHDIDIASGADSNKTTNNVFIFNNDQANRIAARLSGRNGQVNSYSVEE